MLRNHPIFNEEDKFVCRVYGCPRAHDGKAWDKMGCHKEHMMKHMRLWDPNMQKAYQESTVSSDRGIEHEGRWKCDEPQCSDTKSSYLHTTKEMLDLHNKFWHPDIYVKQLPSIAPNLFHDWFDHRLKSDEWRKREKEVFFEQLNEKNLRKGRIRTYGHDDIHPLRAVLKICRYKEAHNGKYIALN